MLLFQLSCLEHLGTDRTENTIHLLFADRCTVAYLVVAAYQWVYMPQYE
jgi:hypothetical protein